MSKIFLISWVVVFVVWMAGSFLVHGMWLGDTYAAMTNMSRPEEEQMGLFHFMLLAHVLMAGVFVWIYQRGKENKPWAQQGLRFGIAIALFTPMPRYMIYYTVQQTPGTLAVQQIIGDSAVIVIVALIVAFLNRDTSAS